MISKTAHLESRVRHDRSEPLLAPRTSWSHALPFPLRTVLRRWSGLIGMVLGVGVALGLGMTIMAMNRASVEMLVGDYRASGADLYAHADGGTLVPVLPGESTGKIRHARNVLSQVRGMPGVTSAFGALTWPLEREQAGRKRRSNEPTELVATVGVDGDPTLIDGAVLLRAGRWLRRSDELVVGAKLAREKRLSLGDVLRLNEQDFRIVGIGRLRGVGMGSDGFAYMDYRSLRRRAEIGDVVNVVVVDTVRPDLARERIPQLDTLTTVGPAELVRRAEEVMQTAIVMRSIVVGLTLVIAGLFVGTMLSRSVSARRLELATLRAIGVPTATIMLIVGAEALLVTVLASVFGILLSLGLGWLIDTFLAPAYGIESLYALDAATFLEMVLIALALGLLAGLAPARRATRVDPVAVLREA